MLALGCPQGGSGWVMYMCARGSRTAPKGCEVLGQSYVFQKQWWGPPQGLERLSRAGLSQNPHLLYYCAIKVNILSFHKYA